MRRSQVLSVLGAGAVLSLIGCSAGPSSTASTVSTTLPTIGHVSIAPSTTIAAPIDTSATSSDSTSGTLSTSSVSVAVEGTTIVNRVVTNPAANARLGDTGPAVKQIQAALGAQGYKLPLTGTFGNLTEQAVTSFQSKHGLKADGIVGPTTWAQLQSPAPATSVRATTTTSVKATSTTSVKATTTTRR